MVNPYEIMYDARMTVKRWREVSKDGFSGSELYVVAADRPCRYSSSGQVPTGTPNPAIRNSHTLFCGLGEDVREGDRIEVILRTGKTVEADLGSATRIRSSGSVK